MFPKAHAAAYVMMAWRVAYCKVFHPLAYYAAYFSIRANGFSYALMCQGRDKLEYHLADYKRRIDTLSKKEQDVLRDMRIVQEMYARGFDFMPIDIYRASAKEDFINRSKVSRTVCDMMAELGLLKGLPESNQLSLFDMM